MFTLVFAGCIMAIEGLPLHFILFSKLWLEIYNKSHEVGKIYKETKKLQLFLLCTVCLDKGPSSSFSFLPFQIPKYKLCMKELCQQQEFIEVSWFFLCKMLRSVVRRHCMMSWCKRILFLVCRPHPLWRKDNCECQPDLLVSLLRFSQGKLPFTWRMLLLIVYFVIACFSHLNWYFFPVQKTFKDFVLFSLQTFIIVIHY